MSAKMACAVYRRREGSKTAGEDADDRVRSCTKHPCPCRSEASFRLMGDENKRTAAAPSMPFSTNKRTIEHYWDVSTTGHYKSTVGKSTTGTYTPSHNLGADPEAPRIPPNCRGYSTIATIALLNLNFTLFMIT